jgi:hypothetical protein
MKLEPYETEFAHLQDLPAQRSWRCRSDFRCSAIQSAAKLRVVNCVADCVWFSVPQTAGRTGIENNWYAHGRIVELCGALVGSEFQSPAWRNWQTRWTQNSEIADFI